MSNNKSRKSPEGRKINTDDRYFLEHSLLPSLVFRGDGFMALSCMIDDVGGYFVKLYKVINSENPGYECPYDSSEFTAKGFKCGDGVYLLAITCPKPEREPLCAGIIISHDDMGDNRRYFTIERGNGSTGLFLCEWTPDKSHRLYSKAVNPLKQVEDIVKKMKKK